MNDLKTIKRGCMKDLLHHLVHIQRKMVQKARKENQRVTNLSNKSDHEEHGEDEEIFALLPIKQKKK